MAHNSQNLLPLENELTTQPTQWQEITAPNKQKDRCTNHAYDSLME